MSEDTSQSDERPKLTQKQVKEIRRLYRKGRPKVTRKPKRRIRRFTDAQMRRMAKFYAAEGWTETVEKFKLSSSTVQKLREMSTNGEAPARGRRRDDTARTGRTLYLLAKKLEAALMEHRQAGSPPSDVESYAFFLLREILK